MIFKKGDKVYDYAYGWGEVIKVKLHTTFTYPIVVMFTAENCISYTIKGQLEEDGEPTLSFTEYTLEGFSQVRPKEPIPFNKGDVCYFSDHIQGGWATNIIVSINKDYEDKPFCSGANWRYLALENPLLNPETKIYTKEDL